VYLSHGLVTSHGYQFWPPIDYGFHVIELPLDLPFNNSVIHMHAAAH
jgi:hypothetical protein